MIPDPNPNLKNINMFKEIVLRGVSIILKLTIEVAGTVLKKRHIRTKSSVIKVNLGCGLITARDWINIDFNYVSLLNCKKDITIKLLYYYLSLINYSELTVNHNRRPCINYDKFHNIMKNNNFYCRNLLYEIPFQDNSINYIYTSHIIGFSFSGKHDVFILKEIHRILKKGGCLRLSLAEDIRKSKVYPEEKYSSDDNAFVYNDLYRILNDIGFARIERSSFRHGDFPDIHILDDYPPKFDIIYREREKYFAGTMYINVFK